MSLEAGGEDDDVELVFLAVGGLDTVLGDPADRLGDEIRVRFHHRLVVADRHDQTLAGDRVVRLKLLVELRIGDRLVEVFLAGVTEELEDLLISKDAVAEGRGDFLLFSRWSCSIFDGSSRKAARSSSE